ncbi:hypothetical protein ACPOL_4726 [Acidisarcina polymorpha]|uniref:Uncharacterized protein n=1 Tax=Acidisarcina polymorpha TaxID=2211140 RepID=A0A2Z5G5G0_9BACT|nr:hypothetical protein [Acidisarcina polymorpha]AXC13994.1 hypothetical protein ACPOL_4726 [Acidisarcina polymorpha]
MHGFREERIAIHRLDAEGGSKAPDISSSEPENFLAALRDWLAQAEQLYAPTLTDEPTRLFQAEITALP